MTRVNSREAAPHPRAAHDPSSAQADWFSVFLVGNQEGAARLEASLEELAARPDVGFDFAGWLSPADNRVEPGERQAHILIVAGGAGPETVPLVLGTALVVVVGPEGPGPWQALAEQSPIVFLSCDGNVESLWLALMTALGAGRRQAAALREVQHLQQRLDDRILIERAKGVLGRRLSISEEVAYKRLRAVARRQRRPLRDVARAVLDMQDLLDLPFLDPTREGTAR